MYSPQLSTEPVKSTRQQDVYHMHHESRAYHQQQPEWCPGELQDPMGTVYGGQAESRQRQDKRVGKENPEENEPKEEATWYKFWIWILVCIGKGRRVGLWKVLRGMILVLRKMWSAEKMCDPGRVYMHKVQSFELLTPRNKMTPTTYSKLLSSWNICFKSREEDRIKTDMLSKVGAVRCRLWWHLKFI